MNDDFPYIPRASESGEKNCEIWMSDTLFKVIFATKDLISVLTPVHSLTTMDIHFKV